MAFDSLRQRGDTSKDVQVNFKNSINGFDKNEVTKYISELVSNFQNSQDALVEQATTLGDEVAVLRREKEFSLQKIKELKAEAAEKEAAAPQVPEGNGMEGLHVLQKENQALIEENKSINREYTTVLENYSKLKDEMDKATIEFKEMYDEKETLSSANVLLSAQIESYSSQAEGRREQIRSLTENNNMLRDEVGKEKASISHLRSELSELNNKVKKLSADIESLTFTNGTLYDEKNILVENISSISSQLDSTKQELEMFKLSEAKLKETLEISNAKLLSNEEELNSLKNEIKKSDAEKKALSQNIGSLQSEIGKLKDAQTSLKAQNEKALSEYQAKINSLSEEAKKATSEKTALLGTLEGLQNEISTMKDAQTNSSAASNEEIANYKKQINSLSEEAKKATSEKTALLSTLQGLQSEISTMKDAQTNSSAANNEEVLVYKNKIAQLTKENADKDLEKNSLVANNESLKIEIEALKNSATSSAGNDVELLAKVSELESKLASSETEKTEYQEEKERLIAQFTAARDAYNQLKMQPHGDVPADVELIINELNVAKQENIKLSGEINQLKTQMSVGGSADVSKLENELESVKKHRETLNVENDRFVKENSRLALEVKNLKSSYDRIAFERDEALANLSKGTTPQNNAKIAQLEEEIKKQVAENSRLMTDTAMYQHEKDRLLNEVKAVRTLCDAAERERDTLKLTGGAANAELEDELRMEISKLKAENNRVSSELLNNENERRKLNDEVTTLRNAQSQMSYEKEDIAMRMQNLDRTNAQMSSMMADFEMYRSKNVELLEKIDDLQEKVELMQSNEESLTNENTYLTNRLQSLKLLNSQLEQGRGSSR